ncbi:ABC-type transport auxiliary lipoprotein family protein [Pseudohongiella spirulinae]|uniref:Putative lipoprotein n=1 Tax=Pseudohongiella spirulinae TaxID=1249552 RepID=A0A0S2KGX2_9GAMM|nr:ABC-type transport auxiliary lipoprotein family protein [Pseudohongiella spirulinae]ALO47530.1 Putative lipoprotein [Pseudohongiella spirulinae]
MSRLICILLVLAASACTVLPERVPFDLYQLPPPAITTATEGQALSALRVDRPSTSEALGGNRLLIMREDQQLQAYADVRWVAATPLLWRDWLLDAFWRDGRVGSLSAASDGLQAQFELGGMLRAFNIDQSGSQPQAVIQFDARLVNVSDRRIVASRRFSAYEPVGATHAGAAVVALGAAANTLAAELIDWAINSGQPGAVGESTAERRVSFSCDDNRDIELRFFPMQGVAVLVRNGNTIELQQEPSASGFRYSNGPNTVVGKGDELTLEIGRMAPIHCHAEKG